MTLPARALRVASLLPSATENVCALLAFCQSRASPHASHSPPLPTLVARSHECDFPASVLPLPVLTAARTAFTSSADTHAQVREALAAANSLYHLDAPLLARLAPDVVLTQSECRVCSIDLATVEASTAAAAASGTHTAQIVACNPKSLAQALVDQFQLLGRALGVAELGDALAQQHYEKLQALQARAQQQAQRRGGREPAPRVLMVEWLDPLFVGKDGWVREIVESAGGEVVESLDAGGGRVDVVVVALCGLSLAQTEAEVRSGRVGAWWHELLQTQTAAYARAPALYLVDGTSHFTRPTQRLLLALEWLVDVLHDSEGAWRATTAFPYKKVEFAAAVQDDRGGDDSADSGVLSPALVEIEELHRIACAKQEAMYTDPATGYSVLTAHFLEQRQTCCGNCCRHCPYGHANVKDASRRTNVVAHDVFLAPPKRRRVKVPSVGGAAGESPGGALLWPEGYEEPIGGDSSTTAAPPRDLVVLFWSGGKDSFLALSHLYESYARSSKRMPQVVLLTTIDPGTNTVPVQNIDVQTVVAQAQALELPLYLVAVGLGAAYASKVDAALQQLPAKAKRAAIDTLAFGDLHLADIRGWREQAFAGRYELAFPVWQKDYATELLPALERLCARTGARIAYSTVDAPALRQRGWKAGDEYKWADVAALNETAALAIDLMGECGEFHTCVKFPGML
ncbi:hypothetical protein PybrP1_009872 [[Pythium] brassicae (nom. inval.)]|nr:hypothetical protein PybrP1_009872 [[Pythium] brassicae (nom. inval.)]